MLVAEDKTQAQSAGLKTSVVALIVVRFESVGLEQISASPRVEVPGPAHCREGWDSPMPVRKDGDRQTCSLARRSRQVSRWQTGQSLLLRARDAHELAPQSWQPA